jgi:hypothetical protein
MLYIEGHWETVESLEDVANVIREYYNRELADALDIFIVEQEEYINELKDDIVNLENWLEFASE